MENLLRRVIKQTVPTHAVKFIITNIISFFLVILVTLAFVIREYNINNIIRADFFALGLFTALGNIVLIITGLASIKDYKRVILQCLEDIKEADEFCENVIKKATEEDNEEIEDDLCMDCYELCDNCEIFKERIKEN